MTIYTKWNIQICLHDLDTLVFSLQFRCFHCLGNKRPFCAIWVLKCLILTNFRITSICSIFVPGALNLCENSLQLEWVCKLQVTFERERKVQTPELCQQCNTEHHNVKYQLPDCWNRFLTTTWQEQEMLDRQKARN